MALRPGVLLLDEPTSALDPISTSRIEQLVDELERDFTVVIVTHSMQQAARISDYTAFMYLGDLVEHGSTGTISRIARSGRPRTTSPAASAEPQEPPCTTTS